MANAQLWSTNGTQAGEMKLSDAHFGVKPSPSLVHEAVVAQMANARRAIAHTKNRGEVRGGGKKPWKQKGTGRARHGSIRSPIWVGGGVTFGPRNERNFAVKVNRRARQKALFMSLSDKLAHGNLLVLEDWKPAAVKTSAFAELISKLPVKKTALFVVAGPSPDKVRMAKNLDHVWVASANSLNVVDVLRYGTIVFEKEAVAEFEKVYAASAKPNANPS
jgi:large subunit ribosomal protein L4